MAEEKTEKSAKEKQDEKALESKEKSGKEKKPEKPAKEKEQKEKDVTALSKEKTEKPSSVKSKDEKVFTIPLRKAFRKSEIRRKNYAISLIKEFLIRHTKAEELKLGSELNKAIWEKGKPPRRIRVKTIKEGSVVKAELLGFEYTEFKAIPKKEKEGMKEKLLGRLGPKALKKEEEEKMLEEKKKPEKPEKIEKHQVNEE